MNNNPKPTVNDVILSPEELPTQLNSFGSGESLEDQPEKSNYPSSHRPMGRIVGLILLAIGVISGILLAIHMASNNNQQLDASQSSDKSSLIKPQSIPLSNLGLAPLSTLPQLPDTLTVNGNVNVADSLVLEPTATPTGAVAGQLYYDQSRNQLGYYNGGSFVYLQGGSGAVTNNVSNVTNNISNGTTGITAINGTAGSISMFNGTGGLTESMINQVGSALTVGTAGGTVTTTLQGGAGGVSVLTGNTIGTSGSIDIASGASSTTAAGNVAVDTGASVITGVVLGDVTFEDGTTDNFAPWFCDTVTPTNTQAHSGSYSIAVTESAGCGNWGVIQNGNFSVFPVTAGHHIVVSMWMKAATTPRQIGGQLVWGGSNPATSLTSATDTTTGWTEMVTTATVPAGATQFILDFGASGVPGEVHYFDDIQVLDLSASTATSVLNLGATNAQVVNIGNMNELGATTIAGGSGITLNSGSAVTVSGSGASSFTTSSGSLTLGSGGGGSTGGVIVKPQNNSTSAFQVQNSAGTSIINVDSTNNVVTDGGNLIVNTPSSCGYATYTNYLSGLTPSSYWKLEDTGTTAADSSGNNDTGTLSNVTTGITPGPFSCASTHPSMSFIAANNSVITTANTTAAPTAYTQVVMFKSASSGTFIGDVLGGNHDRELAITNGGQLSARIYNATFGSEIVTSSNTVNDGNWHIAAVTVSAAGMYLYVDGSLVGSNASYNSPQSYSGTWYLGGSWSNGTQPFTGDLAEVAVIPTALNALQIQTLSADSGFYTANLAGVGIGTTSPAANLDDAGSAVFHDINNSTVAFQVQNSSGVSLFDVNTNSSSVNIGTNGLGSINLGSTAGSIGYTSIGATQDAGDLNNISGGQFTAPYTGALGSISAYIGSNVDASPHNQIQLAIYADNGSNVPGSYIASTAVATITPNSWNTLPISANVTAGTKYWLIHWTNTTNNNDDSPVFNPVGSQSHYYAYTNGVTFGSGPNNGMPATFPGPMSDNLSSNFQSVYASYTATTGPALSVSSTGALTDNGSATFIDATSSTSAFQIQNSSGTAIFTADTANEIITVTNLVATGTLTVDEHIISGGGTPTIAAGAAACSGATLSVNGTDTAGTITVTTGSACSSSGTLATVTFAQKFGTAPHISLTPGGSTALGLGAYVDDSTTLNSSFAIGTNTTPANATTYQWNYQVIQ